MADFTAQQQILVLEQFMDLCDHEHRVGHAQAAVAHTNDPSKPFVPEEHWAWAASKAREVSRNLRETGRTMAEVLDDRRMER